MWCANESTRGEDVPEWRQPGGREAGSAKRQSVTTPPHLRWDSRVAEPAGSCVPLLSGNCRCGQGHFARSRLGRLLVEARTKQLVLCLLIPVPVVPLCSFTHNALLENENGWRSARTANRVCDCGVVLVRNKAQGCVSPHVACVGVPCRRLLDGRTSRSWAPRWESGAQRENFPLNGTLNPALTCEEHRGLEALPWQQQ